MRMIRKEGSFKRKNMFKKLKKIKWLAVLLSLAVAGSACAAEGGKKKADSDERFTIYTSFYPMYEFTKRIVKDRAEVINIMPEGSSSHDFEPSAKQMAEMADADVLIYQGAGMEHWIDKAKTALTAENEDLKFIEAGQGLDLRPAEHVHHHEHEEEAGHEHEENEEAGHEHEEEHHHGQYDPHLWLSLRNAARLAENIAEGLGEIRSEDKAFYEENLKAFKEELSALDEEYSEKLKASGLEYFLITHEAFGYLADDYGLIQKGLSGMGTEQEPDPEKMAEMVRFAREHNIKAVYYDADGSAKTAEILAEEIGAEVLPLYSVHSPSKEQLADGGNYLTLMRKNLDALLEGAPEGGGA